MTRRYDMILVTGPTGHIGKELIPQLAGRPLRLLVRDEKKVAHIDVCIERAVGDLNDIGSLIAAMRGVEKVFLVTIEIQHDANVIKAAKQAGVQHIVKLSTLEATEHKIKVGKWHYEREGLIRASGL